MSVIYINSYQFAAAAPPSGYDPDAAAYIARVEGASGDNATLETAVKDAINAFVVGCKADGIWSAIKASCILAGARTLNGALQPLVGTAPTSYNFTPADYNRKTGLVDNNSDKYLDSNRTTTSDPTDSQHMSVFISSHNNPTSATNQIYIGTLFNITYATLLGRSGGTARQYFVQSRSGGNNMIASAAEAATGFQGVNRPSLTSATVRSLGVSTDFARTTQAPNSLPLMVFGHSGVRANARFAFYSIGESLDIALLDARVTTLINAFAAAIP